jgi:uroporphyrinogen decarboxylase
MNSRERVKLALNHEEADRVPLDIAGTGVSQIHITAYSNLRAYLNLPPREPNLKILAEQLAEFETDIAEHLETDFVFLMPQAPSTYELVFHDQGAYEAYTDEWGIGWKKPKKGGFYYDMYHHPLATAETLADFKAYKLPDPLDDQRYQKLRPEAEAAVERGKAVVLAGPGAGILEIYTWLRGFEQFYIDMALNQEFVAYMLDRLVEFKQAYWARVLADFGDLVDVACEHDDLAGQKALLFSPETYRKVLKPRQKKLFGYLKAQAPVKLFYHTDGAVRPLIWELVEAGIDILNPVQFTAANMDLKELKQEFGRDLVFWGAGVDTQGVLGTGTPAEVKADVQRNIDTLAPGGGFVFATVHDIQANVPPENIMAMWEAWKTYGVYT